METLQELHPLEELYRDCMEVLGHDSFTEVEKKCRDMNNSKANRILNHVKIKLLMSKGKLKEAISLTKKTRFEFGDHIGLVCDLASLYYSTHQYALWNQCLENLESILSSKTIHLSNESYTKTMLLLAKFQEEQGAISKAYSSLLAIEKDAHASLKLRVHANLLRLDVFYGFSNNVSAYYHEVKQSLHSDLGFNTTAEIIHALALAELELFGIDDLQNTLLKTIPVNILIDDLLLIYIDIALLLAQKSIAIPFWISEKLLQLSSANSFEEKILDYISNRKEFTDNWIQWPAQMALGNFFHLSILLNNRIKNEEQKILHKQISLLAKHLPSIDQKYWRKFQINREESCLTINHNDENRLISVEDVRISLKDKKILYEVLILASQEKKVRLSQVAKDIFHSEFNESYYHRIRRLVKRINDEFEEKHLPPPLSCNKNHLLLCAKYL